MLLKIKLTGIGGRIEGPMSNSEDLSYKIAQMAFLPSALIHSYLRHVDMPNLLPLVKS